MTTTARRLGPALLLLLGLVAGGCGGDDEATGSEATTPAVPVPDGVELTDPGSSLEVGDTATAVYEAGRERASVVAVTVDGIRRGTPADLRGFSLSPSAARSTPWYVRAVMRDVGKGQLGRAPVPVYGYDSKDTYFPPARIEGGLDVCPAAEPPAHFGPGDTLRTCLVFFVPPKVRLEAVQLRAEKGVEPISWSIPEQR